MRTAAPGNPIRVQNLVRRRISCSREGESCALASMEAPPSSECATSAPVAGHSSSIAEEAPLSRLSSSLLDLCIVFPCSRSGGPGELQIAGTVVSQAFSISAGFFRPECVSASFHPPHPFFLPSHRSVCLQLLEFQSTGYPIWAAWRRCRPDPVQPRATWRGPNAKGTALAPPTPSFKASSRPNHPGCQTRYRCYASPHASPLCLPRSRKFPLQDATARSAILVGTSFPAAFRYPLGGCKKITRNPPRPLPIRIKVQHPTNGPTLDYPRHLLIMIAIRLNI